MQLLNSRQLGIRTPVRLIALGCVALLLFVAGAEAVHNHTNAAVARNSAPCVICVTAHAKAPTVTVYLPQVFHVLEARTVPYESQGKSAISELSLFIRPPPTSV